MSLLAYRDYLAHHGIKGQKWGIRRFQNEDGSLTQEGRERYGIKDVDSKKLFNEVKSGNRASLEGYKRALTDQGKIIDETSSNLYNARKKDYLNWYRSDKIVKQAVDTLKEEYGDDVDKYDVHDFLDGYAPLSAESKKYNKEYESARDDYLSASKQFINQIVGDLGDVTIKDTATYNFNTKYSEVVRRAIEDPVTNYFIKNEEMTYNPFLVEEMDRETKEVYDDVTSKILKAIKGR